MKKVAWLIVLLLAAVLLAPAFYVWGWVGFGVVWISFGFFHTWATGRLGEHFDPMVGALMAACGPLGLAEAFYGSAHAPPDA